jgi:lipopolysaccharide transport system ATP-binding protein
VLLATIPEAAPAVVERPAAPAPAPAPTGPTILHVTHWKSGSQWLHKILAQAVPDRIVAPEAGQVQVFHWPIRPGGVYPTVYASCQQISALALPDGTRRFVMIRDLRDTLVSAYFSFRHSHPVLDAGFAQLKEGLNALPIEEGMVHLMDSWLFSSAVIQLSWIEAGEPVIRYEDLLARDVEILERTLIDQCGLPVSRERLREVIVANRFERLTGRQRGQEHLFSHERKGVAGDWRNHFTERLTRAFKARYGGVLIATGYEKDLDWHAAAVQLETA